MFTYGCLFSFSYFSLSCMYIFLFHNCMFWYVYMLYSMYSPKGGNKEYLSIYLSMDGNALESIKNYILKLHIFPEYIAYSIIRIATYKVVTE